MNAVRIPSLAWLALIALLAGVIGTELGWGSRLRAELPQPMLQKAKAAVLPLQPDFDLLPLDPAYSEILARPLFVPGRHSLLPQAASSAHASGQHARKSKAAVAPPPKQEEKAVVEEPPKERMRKGQFVLDGIIIAQGKNIALLREMSTRKTVRAELGEEINGMRVEKLEPDRITFTQGEESEVLILKVKTGPKQPARSVPPATSLPAAPAGTAAAPAPAGAPAPGAPAPAPVTVAPDGDPATPSFVERRRALRQRAQQ